jgi:septal ring-binding cell division protein DamX
MNLDKGYVIQIRGFFNPEQYHAFNKKYDDMDLPSFHRIYDEKVYIFVTSTVFENHKSATIGLEVLAPEFKNTGAWVKSIATIQDEIKQYQATQY